MPKIYNCDPSELIEKSAEELKKVEAIKAPSWALIVKTGVHKERPPVKNDWWYTRAASVLRKVYVLGPIGVSKLRVKYGGKKNRGYKPEHFFKGSGSIIRKILQQLEKAGFIKKEEKGAHKGRVITAVGKKFLDNIASNISKIPSKKIEKKKEIKEGKKVEAAEKVKVAEPKEIKKIKQEKKETKQHKNETEKEKNKKK